MRIIFFLLSIAPLYGQPVTSGQTGLGVMNNAGATKTVPMQVGTNAARPTGSCSPGQLYYQTDSTPGVYVNSATGTCSWALTGSGATSISQLTDFLVTRTSGTVLAFNAACTSGAPCIARTGNTTTTFTAGGTATITAGSGTGAWTLYALAGTIVFEHSSAALLTITCSGCTGSQVTTPGFPANSIPMASGTVTSGAYDTTIADKRSLLSTKANTAGVGIIITSTAGEDSFAIDTADVARLGGNNDWTGEMNSSSSTKTRPVQVGTNAARPTTSCSPGQYYDQTDGTSGLYRNAATGTCSWTLVSAGSSTATHYHPFVTAMRVEGVGNAQGGSVYTEGTGTAVCLPNSAGGYQVCGLIMAATGTPTIYIPIFLPSTWTGDIGIQARVFQQAGGTGNASIKTGVACHINGTSDVSGTLTFPTASEDIISMNGGGVVAAVSRAAIALHASVVAGRHCLVRIQRDGADSDDTYANDIYFTNGVISLVF